MGVCLRTYACRSHLATAAAHPSVNRSARNATVNTVSSAAVAVATAAIEPAMFAAAGGGTLGVCWEVCGAWCPSVPRKPVRFFPRLFHEMI